MKPSDVVVVFPPCTEFSRALTSRPRDLKAGSRNVKSALKVTAFVRQLAGECAWCLENPVGLLHRQRFMAPMEPHKNVCTYCRYGKAFKKPTHVWSNVPDLELKACSRDAPCTFKRECGFHPVTAQAGSSPNGRVKGSGGGRNVYPIPSKLCTELFRKAIAHLGDL